MLLHSFTEGILCAKSTTRNDNNRSLVDEWVHFVMEKLKKTAVCNDIAVVSVFCKRAVVGELTLLVCLGRPKST